MNYPPFYCYFHFPKLKHIHSETSLKKWLDQKNLWVFRSISDLLWVRIICLTDENHKMTGFIRMICDHTDCILFCQRPEK